jgi:hypothetical protein
MLTAVSPTFPSVNHCKDLTLVHMARETANAGLSSASSTAAVTSSGVSEQAGIAIQLAVLPARVWSAADLRLTPMGREHASAIGGDVSQESTTRVRSTDATILDLLNEGNQRSATFHALTATIGRLDGIVYIESGYCALGHLNGCTSPIHCVLSR